MNRPIVRVSLALLIVVFGAASMAPAQSPSRIEFTVDVAEAFDTFVLTDVNAASAGEPVRGAWFVTGGRIFPGGTIQGDGSDFDPESPGSIGTWHCRGTHIADFDPENPLWVLTSQLYVFESDQSIATDGVEGSMPVVRAVIGGTGQYRGYIGEQRQQLLGFNASGGVNLRVTFVLRKAAN